MLMREIAKEGSLHLFEVGEGGNGAQVIVEHNTILPAGRQGFGTVHHAAFRVEDTKVLYEWIERMKELVSVLQAMWIDSFLNHYMHA